MQVARTRFSVIHTYDDVVQLPLACTSRSLAVVYRVESDVVVSWLYLRKKKMRGAIELRDVNNCRLERLHTFLVLPIR